MSQLVLDDLNISVILNSNIGLLRDKIELEVRSIEEWINSLVYQSKSESLKRKQRCDLCDSKEDYFEGHHIAGRKHDYRQITVCKPCHDELSKRQKLRTKDWLDSNSSQTLREAFFFHGLYDILILKSKKTGCSIYEKYASLLIEYISKGILAN